jgi:hypothetical protein
MTVSVAACVDVTSRDRPVIPAGRAGVQLVSQLLLATAATATVGVTVVAVALTAWWTLGAMLPHRHGGLASESFGLRRIALVPWRVDAAKGLSPADIVVFPQSAAVADKPIHVAKRIPVPRAPVRTGGSANKVPIPLPVPPALASLRSAEKLASLPPAPLAAPAPRANSRAAEKVASLPSAPPPVAEKPVAPRHADKPPPVATSGNRTAIYDISAHEVYLPNGKALEAHSGLGDWRDDPRYIRLKGRGPTPPNTYDLTLREQLFHGVRAIRLTPVDDDKMFGRAGMLAHTYMLGPDGDSNGCVSFKNYPAFLRAYLNGEIDRLMVVSGRGAPFVRSARVEDIGDMRYAANER